MTMHSIPTHSASSPRKRGPSNPYRFSKDRSLADYWMPAFAGMTAERWEAK